MFTLISKIVSYFLKENQADDSKCVQAQSSSDSIEQNNYSSLEDCPWLIKRTDNVKSQSLQGQVTHVFHNHGLINGDVYFSMSDVHGDDKLQVGDKVHLRAVQHHEDGGWYAEDITIINQTWDHQTQDEPKEIDLSVLQSKVVIGEVTLCLDGIGRIDKDIVFDTDSCKDGYVPMKGDWVSAYLMEHETKSDLSQEDGWGEENVRVRTAYNVCPARTRNFEGCITAAMNGHGYVSGETFFDKTACLNGYQPVKNDKVTVTAIESMQGKCEWRAVSVVPLSTDLHIYRTRQFRQPSKQVNASWLVPGERPRNFPPRVMLPVKLPHFTVPENLERAVLEGTELTEFVPQLMKDLSFHNYVRRMSTLLHLEEIQMQMDIREFDMNRVCLHPVGEFLALTVPGLAEGRPSILIGDKVILSSPVDPDGPSYIGYVHELTSTDVHLKFSPEFHGRYGGEDYNVQFTFGRTPLRRCHQAVSLAVQFLGSKVLFPNQVELKKPQVSLENLSPKEVFRKQSSLSDKTGHQLERPYKPVCIYTSQDVRSKPHVSPGQGFVSPGSQRRNTDQGLRFFNSRLNEKQKSAAMKILLGQGRPIPYVIFGPPGTGKTITVVEAILQVLHHIPSSRILACTPSNSAADLIAERLHSSGQVEQMNMVRLNAFQRSVDSIPESILKYCRFAEDLKMISRFRVIISTCTMAGHLYGLGLSAGHITHVFVDECGQATEPECLIPLGLLSGTDGQIVLAGDPKQLGPIVLSPFAKQYGLELSFLERLMMRESYQRNEAKFEDDGGFDPLLVTMLVENYRSHPSILELSSHLFYYGQLQAVADPQVTHLLAKWQELPTPHFPVIFHGIRGEDIREENSPSWFNPGETIQAMRYLQAVLTEGVNPNDIGIITPYRKQVEKIRLMIEHLHLPDVKVGSVEEFQGQERLVIIISTVRSTEKLVGFDVRHTLGFLSNPKRFNVSITRAQALLIIVGNPVVLCLDPNWRMLIQYCAEKGGYTGCDLPDISGGDDGDGQLQLLGKETE